MNAYIRDLYPVGINCKHQSFVTDHRTMKWLIAQTIVLSLPTHIETKQFACLWLASQFLFSAIVILTCPMRTNQRLDG